MFTCGPGLFGVIVYSSLDPSHKSSAVTLSGNNLIATNNTNSSSGSARGLSILTGKRYWETVITAMPALATWATGICNASENLSGSLGYSDANAWAWWGNGTGVRHNGTTLVSDSGSVNNIIGIAYDSVAGNLWFSRNGIWLGTGSPNPGTGTSPNYTGLTGNMWPAVCPWGSTTPGDSICTIRFNPASFSYSIPSGFSSVYL